MPATRDNKDIVFVCARFIHLFLVCSMLSHSQGVFRQLGQFRVDLCGVCEGHMDATHLAAGSLFHGPNIDRMPHEAPAASKTEN